MRLWSAALVLAASAGVSAACQNPPWSGAVPGSLVQLDAARAWYEDLTDRYAHGVLGDALEPTTLHVAPGPDCTVAVIASGSAHVFEDTAPRLADVTGDGLPEVIAVRSHRDLGAQLVVYSVGDTTLQPLAETPHIGRRNRWLAPSGVGDLDGDGHVEIAYVDRPHLARTLRIWRWRDGEFREVASLAGVTNHRIGEDFISGGLRQCNAVPELVLASADWTRLLAIRFDGGAIESRDVGPWSAAAAEEALSCAS